MPVTVTGDPELSRVRPAVSGAASAAATGTGQDGTGQEATTMVSPAGTGPGGRDRRPRPLLRTTLGDVLRRTRLAQRRTLADVARAAKVSLPYLSELERGRKEGSSEVLAAVSDALGIELADLVLQAGAELGRQAAQRAQVIRLAEIRTRITGRPAAPQRGGHAPTASARLSLAA